MNKIDKIIDSIESLPPFPTTLSKVLAMLRDPKVSPEAVADTVKLDQALTTLVLRYCNSSFFGLRRQINNLKEAVVYIGLADLKKIIVRSGTRQYFEKKKPGYEATTGELWGHVLAVSILAEKVKLLIKGAVDDDVFVSALLHDVGKLVLSEYVDSDTKTIFSLVDDDGLSFLDAEKKILGIGHNELGAKVLEKWGFPENIREAVRKHHNASEESDTALDDIIKLADGLAMAMGYGTNIDGLAYRGYSDICDKYDLSETDLEKLMAETIDEIKQIESEYGFSKEG